MIRRSILPALGVVFFAVASTAHAQTSRLYEFLRNESSARAAAMGGSFVTVTDDPAALHYNPATLASVKRTQASFTFFKHLLDINSGYASAATTLDGIGQIGFGVDYTSYGSFDRTDRLGNVSGSFGAGDVAFTAAWATDLGEGFSAGVAGKLIYSSISDFSSTALALDGGLLWVDTTHRVQAGLSILNLGSQVSSYDGQSEEMPLDLTVGVSHRLQGLPLLLALNFHRLLDGGSGVLDHLRAFTIGGEFTIADPLRLRIGYNNAVREDLAIGGSKGLGGLSAGVGVLVGDYRFDYAFSSMARLGAQHRISVNATW